MGMKTCATDLMDACLLFLLAYLLACFLASFRAWRIRGGTLLSCLLAGGSGLVAGACASLGARVLGALLSCFFACLLSFGSPASSANSGTKLGRKMKYILIRKQKKNKNEQSNKLR